MFRKEEIKLLWPFYLEAFLGTALFVMLPFFVLYFDSLGLNITQISILLAIMPLASLIFEIPTGAIADLYGRKVSVMLGWFLNGVCLIIVFFLHDYYWLLFLFFLIGIFQTLSSGSYEAWVVDLLRWKNMKNFVGNYFSKRQSLINLGFVISGIVGAFFVARFGVQVIWILSGIALLISVLFLYFGKEVYDRGGRAEKNRVLQIWGKTRESFVHGFRHNVLLYLFIIAFIWGIVITLDGVISWTPLLKSENFPDYAFGYLWSAASIVGIIAPMISMRFIKKNKEKNFLIINSILALVYGTLILLSGNLKFLIFLYLFGYFLLDSKVPVWNSYFHRFVPGKLRATIGSIQSMIFSLAGIIFLPVAGFLVDKIGARYTLFISGLLAIPILILYSRIKRET